MSKAARTVSLADLNLIKKAEVPFKMNYIDPASGEPTGVFLHVLGAKGPTFTNWLNAKIDERNNRRALLKKRGRELEEETMEETQAFLCEAAAVRVVGWDGITEPFSKDLCLELMHANPELRGQVIEASNQVANFSKG